MKIKHVSIKQETNPVQVLDCSVSDGYRQGPGGTLADVDIDFQSDRRQEVKEYLERRYNINGKQRVFSAGTLTTLKIKAAIKDVARVHRVPLNIVNYITSIFDDDKMTWTDLFKLAFTNKKVKKFITDYPQVIEEIRPLMGQPRSGSIHASAILITPEQKDGEEMECFDYTPLKKVDDVLVSELDGYSLDEVGLLKNDCLGIKELSKIQSTINECNRVYDAGLRFDDIVKGGLDDEKTYRLLSDGFTQNVFQFSSKGMTKFLMDMKPTNIHDLIAANALYRPATIEAGSTERYLNCKRGDVAPVYLWGTYEALKNTYGQLCIAEDSVVQTKEGNKPIQQVRAGDYVLTEDGTYQYVSCIMCKGEKQTIRVRTTHGEELVCTKDHKVLTQYGWVESGELIPKKHLIKGFWMSDEATETGTLKDWCLGIYLANGSYAPTGTPSIACRNKAEAETIAGIFDECFDLNSVVYFCTRCWYVRLTYTKDSWSNHTRPNPFKEYLKFIGLDECLSYDKFIPIKPTLMLLSGFFEGDGCMSNGLVRIVNPYMAKQIFYALQSFRIPSSYFETYENGQKVNCVKFGDNATKKLQYVFKKRFTDISIRSCGCRVPSMYLNTVDFKKLQSKYNAKYLRSRMKKNIPCYLQTIERYGGSCEHDVWGMVLSVKEDGIKRTYDISVENNHSFCVGGLVVHNCYQEQVAQIARELGGFSLGEGVNLLKLISKKRTDKIRAMKEKFIKGAKVSGCPKEDALQVWDMIELSGSYLFNASHATAYAITAYTGAWLKANYPTAFYTVALQWADDKEIPALMSEMEQCSSAMIVPPDVNVSEAQFFTDYATDEIFWSLTRIKMLGKKAVDCIIEERERNGAFLSIENFIFRIFRYKLKKYEFWDDPDNAEESTRVPVNARHVKNMILAGCFDNIEKVKSVTDRYDILSRAARELGFELADKDFPDELISKHYFWSMQQIAVSGIGSIDYRRIFDSSDLKAKVKGKASYMELRRAFDSDNEGKRIVVCATVSEAEEKAYKDKMTGEQKKFAKIMLQQNNDMMELVCWSDFLQNYPAPIGSLKNKVIIVSVVIKYSDYSGANSLTTYKSSLIQVM